jgi:nicotinamide riboside kinase
MSASKIRRLNFYGGPGSGKSTIAARAFADLKIKGHDVEHVSEFVKTMAHEGRFPQSYDQIHIFGEQIHREDIALRHVDAIVTDCPILLCCAYAKFYKAPCWKQLSEISNDFETGFRSQNFLIERTVDYKDDGRYQNLDQAKEFDDFLKEFLSDHIVCDSVIVEDFDNIMEKVDSHLLGLHCDSTNVE